MASTSTASDYQYDIFINHRGPDVKKKLASHLYRRLVSHGFRVFLDLTEMQVGKNSISQIEGAIATASCHIAIFSPTYVESPWCLDELVQMLDTTAPIVPVFYNVKPSELRWTSGEKGFHRRILPWLTSGKDGMYAKALRKLKWTTTYDVQTHRMKPLYEPSTIEKWRDALSRVSYISGLELEACNGDEGLLCDKIVQWVEKSLRKKNVSCGHIPYWFGRIARGV